jgi:hypothetical protein
MKNILLVAVSLILAFHGLIHLMGATAYLKLGVLQGLPYKTTVLGGRVDLGELGIAVFGALWAVAALGFVSSVAGLFTNQTWWRLVLLATTLLSLVLTALDSSAAFIGVMVNLVILVVLWLESRDAERHPMIHG